MLVCFAFASCGEDEVVDTQAHDVTNAEEDTITLSGDFKGEEFRILSAGQSKAAANDFNFEEDTSSTLDQAQYKRVLTVESDFNVDIVEDIKEGYSSASSGTPGPGFTLINTQVASGTTNYDLALIASYDVSQLATIGYLFDMNSVPNLDLSNSWWDQNAIKSLGIRDVVFFTTGDITVSDNNTAYCIMFNKKLAEDYGIDDPYEIVNSGKWTIEKLTELSKKVSEDLNQDGVYDENDRYGLLVWDDSITGIVNAAGQRCATINSEGKIELTLYNETTLDALNQYTELAYDSQYAFRYQRKQLDGKSYWQNNQGLFFTALVGEMPSYREMENDFGILPYPKLNEVQENYYTTISPYNSQFMCIPVVNSNIQRTGILTEALGYYGEKDITPALYDVTLKGQSARDSESSEMLDIIFENIVYDIGYYYQFGPYNKQLILYLREGNNAWASMYETYVNAAQSSVDTINKAYDSAVALWK